jgi:hypothetical protein
MDVYVISAGKPQKLEQKRCKTRKGNLGPHYDVLSGKVETFVNAISDIKARIEKALGTFGWHLADTGIIKLSLWKFN